MYNKESPETIQELFASIAKQYDRTNGILSFQMHKGWNRALVRAIAGGKTLLDLCCGTGEIAMTYLRRAQTPCRAYLLDFCEEMLACAKHKFDQRPLLQHEVSFLQADAQEIPLPDQSIDCATIAYGIRNVQDPARCIHDVFRVLKPGGRFGILELTQPKSRFLRLGHQLYLRGVLPTVGKVVAQNKQAYQYLCQSIQNFVKPEELEKMLGIAGFEKVHSKPLTGGIATLILAQKPLS